MVSADACCWHAVFAHHCAEPLGDDMTFWYTEHRRSVASLGLPDPEIPSSPPRGTPVLFSISSHFVDRR